MTSPVVSFFSSCLYICNVSFCVLQGQVSNVGGAVTYSVPPPTPYGYPGFGVGSEQWQKVS